jgi:V/A-type H+-transporting ATPase subunit A
MTGTITHISGVTVTVDLQGLRLYDQVRIGHRRLTGEVVRLEKNQAVVQVYEECRGLAIGEPVEAVSAPLCVTLGPGLLGTMFDGLQRPLESLLQASGAFIESGYEAPPIPTDQRWQVEPAKEIGDRVEVGEIIAHVQEQAVKHPFFTPVAGRITALCSGDCNPHEPLAVIDDDQPVSLLHDWPIRRPRPVRRKLTPTQPLITGQRCLDLLFPMVKGGVAVFPGGFGTGKTVLEQSIAKYADVDVVVYVGCGERGNEMAELLDEFSTLEDPRRGGRLMDRTIVIANTSNMPVAAREASIYTAVSMAEYYRDMGFDVLLLADSISRWAEALREISSSLEEMPGEEGYPTYIASRLSSFLERAGVVETLDGRTGTLSMMLAVSPPGGDFTEPVTQCCLRAAGAFYMLDSRLAHSRHFPAVNWTQSYSQYEQQTDPIFDRTVSADWSRLRSRTRALLQKSGELREIAEIAGHEGLQDDDRLLLHCSEQLQERFLRQNAYSEDAFSTPDATIGLCRQILAAYDSNLDRLKAGDAIDTILQEANHATG